MLTLEQIKELKSFPKGSNIITYEDHAKLSFRKTLIKTTPTGRNYYEYVGNIGFTYPKEDPIDRLSVIKSKSFSWCLKQTLILFEMRNRQMKSRLE